MPTRKQIDAILPFLDRFALEEFSVGSWHHRPSELPWFEFSQPVSEFRQALYDNGWITTGFDWTNWQKAAAEYVENPKSIRSADVEILRKLLTTHVRKERFCEGHLASMFENGHIVALLRRLKEVRENRKDKRRSKDRLHSRKVERKGRILLEEELFKAGFETAIPWNDSGIDLIAYGVRRRSRHFVARPIQLKASSGRSFGIHEKYARIPGLLLVYVWNLSADQKPPRFFALSYVEAAQIADTLGWERWKTLKKLRVPNAGPQVQELLNPYEVHSVTQWRRKICKVPPLVDGKS